jgi:hypothetical protein
MTNYELYVDTIKTFAGSQGYYSRMLRDFNEMSKSDKQRLEVALNDYPQIKDTVEMCMFLEGGLDIKPEKKYGKKIIAQRSIEVNGSNYTCYVLDDGGEYYDIHVVDHHYADDDSNTLKLQEPKDVAQKDIITSKAFMLGQIMEHVLWHECYGENGKMYDFCVEYEESALD